MGKEALADSVRSGESPSEIPPAADPDPARPRLPQHGLIPALEPAWGWQRRVQPGESPCPPAQPVPCSDSRELPSRTLLTALPGDAEASVPPPG